MRSCAQRLIAQSTAQAEPPSRIARLRRESHLNERITPRGSHQRLSQQNLPKAAALSRLLAHIEKRAYHGPHAGDCRVVNAVARPSTAIVLDKRRHPARPARCGDY